MANTNEIVPGISIDAAGQATVDAQMGQLLFDLALQLEDAVTFPVDVEHVLAAIVLAARSGEIDASTPLTIDNAALLESLRGHIETVFEELDGSVGDD